MYRFTRPFEVDRRTAGNPTGGVCLHPCGSQDISRFGWTRPFGKLGHPDPCRQRPESCCARREDKIPPTTVIKEALAEKVEAIEYEQGRPLKKKEKEALRKEIMHTLLPRAFSRTSQTFAWLNPADGLLMVDAPPPRGGRCAGFCFAKSIGSLPVVPVALKNPPDHHDRMAARGNLPAAFTMEDDPSCSAMEHGRIARFKQHS